MLELMLCRLCVAHGRGVRVVIKHVLLNWMRVGWGTLLVTLLSRALRKGEPGQSRELQYRAHQVNLSQAHAS